MPWIKHGDTGATHPVLMRVAALPLADARSVNELAGFFWRLTTLSSAHTTDYIVDAGTVAMIGGANIEQLLKISLRAGLLTKVRDPEDKRLWAYKLYDDPDFVHIRLKAEIEWERQQKADCNDDRLAVPVRLRDGDQCRYCRRPVYFGGGRPSVRTGTLDHLEPGKAGTPDTMVVACKECNSSLRAAAGEERKPPLLPPLEPFFSPQTAKWLTKKGHPVQPTGDKDEPDRPGIQPDTDHDRPGTQPDTDPRAAPRRPGSQPDHDTTSQAVRPGIQPDTDASAAPSGVDLATSQTTTHADPGNSELTGISMTEEMDLAGSGRDGTGIHVSHSPPPNSTRKRKRGPRGQVRPGGP